ncbi:MAG TPA: hypothetical protein VIL20_16300 [Sandaracinaceae bacterium]
MTNKKRARTKRRAMERALTKLEDAREKLALLEPGGAPERPIEVTSASVVEPHALGLGCARCAGTLRLEAHDALATEHGPRRRVRARCTRCRATRVVWLHIAAAN